LARKLDILTKIFLWFSISLSHFDKCRASTSKQTMTTSLHMHLNSSCSHPPNLCYTTYAVK
jgi:hypothetical protein